MTVKTGPAKTGPARPLAMAMCSVTIMSKYNHIRQQLFPATSKHKTNKMCLQLQRNTYMYIEQMSESHSSNSKSAWSVSIFKNISRAK